MTKVVLAVLTLALLVFVVLVSLMGMAQDALGHGENHRDVITVKGTPFCVEDERLVPVKHHGYDSNRTGGWVYTCKPFDDKGRFAR